jgi:hypothetical protein
LVAIACMMANAAVADRIKNPVAMFSGLDKITGRIIAFEVQVNETVQFGSLQLTPRVCYSRPPYENPNTTSFIEVDEITISNEYKRIFGGWMYASSPGLSAIDHAVYDIWLTDCKGGDPKAIEKIAPEVAETPAAPPPSALRPATVGQGQTGKTPPKLPTTAKAPTQRFFPTNVPPAPSSAPPPPQPRFNEIPFDPAARSTGNN